MPAGLCTEEELEVVCNAAARAPAPPAPAAPAPAAASQFAVAENQIGELRSAAAEIGALCERLEAIGGWDELRDEMTNDAGNGHDNCNGNGLSSNGNGNGNGAPTNGAPTNGALTNGNGAPTAAGPSGLPPGLGDGHQRRAALVRSALETAAAAEAAAQASREEAGEAARRNGMSAQGHRTQVGQAADTPASASASRPEWSAHERELLAKAIKKTLTLTPYP